MNSARRKLTLPVDLVDERVHIFFPLIEPVTAPHRVQLGSENFSPVTGLNAAHA
jgi:hypothetical protein